MKYWTAYLRGQDEPVLVREGFAWGAFLFGPLWLAWHRAWIPAAISLAVSVLIQVFVPAPVAGVLLLAGALWLGLTGHDLRRWTIAQRGYVMTHVLAARTEPEALGRLLTARPDLAARFMPASLA